MSTPRKHIRHDACVDAHDACVDVTSHGLRVGGRFSPIPVLAGYSEVELERFAWLYAIDAAYHRARL